MRVDLGRIEMLMAEHLLHGFDVHAVLQHQRRRRVAQLVRGVFRGVEPRGAQVLFDERVDARAADALVARREEEGVTVAAGDGAADGETTLERILTGVVQVDDAHLVALAEHAQRVVLNVLQIKTAELGDSQPAVQKDRQDAVVALAVLPVDRLQKLDALVKRQVLRQRFFDLGGVKVLAGICVQKMRFIDQIVVKRPNRRDFSRSGRGI